MSLTVRPASAGMVGEFRNVLGRTFGWDMAEERQAAFLSTWEPERSFCAFDGATMVGTSGAYSLEMTVPGGLVRAGGTTMVAVLPTHRRQGALRMMMAAHLDDVQQREEPVAALWASDSGIYGRFGYGMASMQHELTIDPRHASFHRGSPPPVPVRITDPESAHSLIPVIYERLRRDRPGFIHRSQPWWEDRLFSDHSNQRGGATAFRFAVAEDESGYMIYRQKSGWEDGHGTGEVRVIDLVASTPGGWAGLWRLALSHDLVTKVVASLRPPDDPLFDLLAAPRRAVGRIGDGVWVRLLDLPVALASRAYQHDGRLLFRVTDPFLDRSEVVELVVEGGMGEARPTSAEPDISLDIEDFSAAYLGLSRFQSLAALNRLEGETAAFRLADRMFTWSPQPWCPEIF